MSSYKIGNKLYKYRTRLGLSQTQLALELGITNKAISKWENGQAIPSTEILIKLSDIFNTTIDELLKEDKVKKKVTKIVITGGPCAGKTTAMSWIQNKFTKDGYDVVFVSETATELINSGITPVNTNGVVNFQKTLLELQLRKEMTYNDAVEFLNSDKILMVFDRGCADMKGYLSDRDYRLFLKQSGKNEIDLRDSYDAVFHLVTAANGADSYYTLANNQARYETINQAKEVDKRLISAWRGHPHLRIIDNSTNFEDKMKKLISEISHFLGEPDAYEIERKYLIEYPDIALLEKKATSVEIIQTYLKSDNGDEIRIRQRGNDGNYVYTMAVKKTISGVKRVEIEKRLTRDEYLDLLLDADTNLCQIRKTRYCLTYKNQYFELDIYPFWNDKAILEIELQHEDDKIIFPKYLNILEEVTDNIEYKNHSLAKRFKK